MICIPRRWITGNDIKINIVLHIQNVIIYNILILIFIREKLKEAYYINNVNTFCSQTIDEIIGIIT